MTCKACKLEHEPWIRCEVAKARAKGGTPAALPFEKLEPAVAEENVCVDQPGPIRQAEEFLRKVGRPRKHPDRKVYMRELMRKRRVLKPTKD